MKEYKYIIIGTGIAGGEAVDGIREVDEDGDILVISQEQHRPYERPPLSKTYLVEGKGLDELVYLENEDYYEDAGVQFALGLPVVSLDPGARTVTLTDSTAYGYGKLLLATGAQANRLPLRNAGLPNIFTLRTIDDSQAIRAAARAADRAVVLGGSFIGAETAASLTQLGLEVDVVFPGAYLLERIAPPDLGQHLEDVYREQGVTLHGRSRPAAFVGSEQVTHVDLEGGDRLAADMVVMGVGVKLNTNLAAKAGLELDPDGALIVDEQLRTSDPHIYAAGDIAAWPDPTFKRRMRVEHWDVARSQGRTAGANMAGAENAYAELPYFFSDLFDLSFELWGDLEGGWDHAFRRGEFDGDDGFAYFYFRDGRLVGALDAGRPEPEHKAMPEMVAARAAPDEVEERLRRLPEGEGAG